MTAKTDAKMSGAEDGDAMLDPYPSLLAQTPESSLLSGAGVALEIRRFWTHRFAAYASYFDKLARCGSIQQVVDLQTTFWQDMQRDYASEGAAIISATTLTGPPSFARNNVALPAPFLAPDQTGRPAGR